MVCHVDLLRYNGSWPSSDPSRSSCDFYPSSNPPVPYTRIHPSSCRFKDHYRIFGPWTEILLSFRQPKPSDRFLLVRDGSCTFLSCVDLCPVVYRNYKSLVYKFSQYVPYKCLLSSITIPSTPPSCKRIPSPDLHPKDTTPLLKKYGCILGGLFFSREVVFWLKNE